MLPKSPSSALWCQWVNGLISMSYLIYLSTSPWIELLRFSQYFLLLHGRFKFPSKVFQIRSLSRHYLSGVKFDMPLSVNLPFLTTFILCRVRIYAKEAERLISPCPYWRDWHWIRATEMRSPSTVQNSHIWPFKPNCQLNLTHLWSCWYSQIFVLCSLRKEKAMFLKMFLLWLSVNFVEIDQVEGYTRWSPSCKNHSACPSMHSG